ncbi:MAG: allophanate hydrolase [Alphaproteobacteria bacterium]|jgi:allophanate hydrolase|nr:allophanate hydrolase [Alphaproteobacteria bacterium]
MDRRSGVVSGLPESLDLASLAAQRRAGLTPTALARAVLERISGYPDEAVWIHLVPEAEVMDAARALEARGPDGLPLYGVPFAVKDNIDVAGLPTTAACPDFAYVPKETAPAVQALLDAGALLIGKTNLDQFATGLVGVRSPYGVCLNAIDPCYVPGGSSAGSGVAVAAGLVSFALGTDTAGSGRIPAAFNNVVGLKPTRGLLSARGVVPACRSLDCVSVFAATCADAVAVLDVMAVYDPADAFARPAPPVQSAARSGPQELRIGVPRPDQLAFFGNPETPLLFEEAVARLAGLGAEPVEIDFGPFAETAALLYGGPWVAERHAAIRDFFDARPDALHPVTREIIAGAARYSATDAFAAQYRLAELRRAVEPVWQAIDVLATPTAGTIYTIAQVLDDPIRLNTNLGFYTNFMNLLDLCAVAVPSGRQGDGLPFGITLSAPAFRDRALLALAGRYHAATGLTLGAGETRLPPADDPSTGSAPHGAGGDRIPIAVCGAHMSGMPLNAELTGRGGALVHQCLTAPLYRFYALPGGPPDRPGLVRAVSGGAAIAVEVWSLPAAGLGSLVAAVPPPLAIGTVELETGERVKGFLCEAHAAAGAHDITEYGSWRTFLAAEAGGGSAAGFR